MIGEILIEIKDKKKCCGCSACVSICPQKCIKMVPDEEGFLYPYVNKDLCIGCGLCERNCPVKNAKAPNGSPKAVIVRNIDEKILRDSTSGGAFTAFATALIKEKNAIVYGAAFDENFMVKHVGVNSVEDLWKFRGSKFVQSEINGLFECIKEQLASGRTVLFSGTPCQISALKIFLGSKYTENLYCCDIVCRGVPSPLLWKEYIKWIENKFGSKIKNIKFRNKTYGYHSSTMFVEFQNSRIYKKSGRIDPMMRLFTKEMCSRPSCSECSFKTKQRVSDLTMFDCKRYEKLTGKSDDDKGYTALLIQSQKGRELLEMASSQLSIESIDADRLIEQCGVMVYGRAKQNPKRNAVFEEIKDKSIEQIAIDLCNIGFKDKSIEYLKSFLYVTGLIKIARRIKKHEVISIDLGENSK